MVVRLWRQRRRLLFCTGVLGVGLVFGLHPVLAGWVGVVAIATILAAPRARAVAEYYALAQVLPCVAGLPNMPTVVVAFLALVALLLVSERLTPWLVWPLRLTGQVHVDLAVSPDRVWPVVDIDPDTPPGEPLVSAVTRTEDGRLRVQFVNGLTAYAVIRDRLPGGLLDYRLWFDGQRMRAEGRSALEPTSRGTRLSLQLSFDRVPLMRALIMMLDDHWGDAADHYAAVAEGRPDRSILRTAFQR